MSTTHHKDGKKKQNKAGPDGHEGFAQLDDSPQQKLDDHEECSTQTTVSDTPTEQSDDYVYEEEEEEDHEDGASATGTDKKKKGLKKVWSKLKHGSRKSSKSSLKSPMSPAPHTVSTLSQQAVDQRRNTGSFSSYEDVPSPHGSGAGESVRMKEINTGQSSKETEQSPLAMNLALPTLEPAATNRLTLFSGSETQSSATTSLTAINSHPLEDSQTSTPRAKTPSTDHLSPSNANTASKQVISPDNVVFTIGKENSTTKIDKDQIEKLQRENAELVKKQSESEQTIQRMHQESTDQIQRIRVEREEARRSEIERILTEATSKHEKEYKQRLADLEEANKKRMAEIEEINQRELKTAIAKTTKQTASVSSRLLKEKDAEIAKLNNQHRQMSLEVSKVPALENQIESLKRQLEHAESFRKDAQVYQEQLVRQLGVVSVKEEEIQKLKEKLQHLSMENSQLASIQVNQDKSQEVHIPQIHGAHVACEDGGSAQVAKLQAKVKELEEKLKHKEEMVDRLKRVAVLTLPSPDPLAGNAPPQGGPLAAPGGKGHPQKEPEVSEKARKGSSGSDKESGKKEDGSRDGTVVKLEAKVAQLRKMVHEREQTIADRDQTITEQSTRLKVLEKTAADTFKIVAHSKNQSRKILELREQLKQYEGGASAESTAQQVETEIQALQKSKTGLAAALAASQHENEQLKSRQTQYDITIRQLQAKNAQLDMHVLKLTEQAQEYATSQYQETEKERKVLELREQLKQYEGGASAESSAQQVEAELQALQKSKTGLAAALAASQHENEQLKSRQIQYDTTVRQLQAQKAQLDKHLLKLTEQAQEFATTKQEETERKRQKLEKRVGELMMTLETVQVEKKILVEQFETFQKVEEKKNHLDQMVINQQAVIDHNRKALEDSQGRAQHLATTVEQMKDEIQQLRKEKFSILDELEAHKLTAATFREDFQAEREDREKAHHQIATMEREYQQLKDSIKDIDKLHAKEKQLKNALNQKASLENQLDRVQAEKEQYKSQNNGYIAERDQFKSRFQETRVELGKVNDQLQQARARMEDCERQICYYQEELRKKTRKEGVDSDELAPFQLHFQDPLPDSRKVGSGCYGTVYAIEVDGVQCIAKRVQDILLGEGGQEDVGGQQSRAIQRKFRQECILLSKIRHPNIVQFMGVRYGRDMYDLTLVMERLPMDLQKCLERCQVDKFFIPLSVRFSILLDVTYGLLHLHNRSILHRDLTAGNILLTSNIRAKIADLGVSRIIDARLSQQLSKVPGSVGYMAPEALKENPEYNLKLDVFSFGVLALFVALQVFPEVPWDPYIPDSVTRKGERELHKRRKWISTIGDRHFLYPLIHRCLQDNSNTRPSTAELNAMMKRLSSDFPRRVQDINKMLLQLSKLGMSYV